VTETALQSWLYQAEPWAAYRARLDLWPESPEVPAVIKAREELLAHPLVQTVIAELAAWPGTPLNSHKSAGHLIHKLTFVADLGLNVHDPGITTIVEKVLAHQAPEGPFQSLMNISPKFGGAGIDQWTWVLCDAPLLLYALARLGLTEDSRVQRAARYLSGLVRENGWPCVGSPEIGTFRGPGNKSDPCPYANLVMLKALAIFPEWQDHPATRQGVEAQLTLWAERRERHPYIFWMGTDFCKLKAPLVWYDLLHVLEVLTQFPWACHDERLHDMTTILTSKADLEGRFTPESVWKAWSEWDFGQKRRPSAWLTVIAQRILRRIAMPL